MPANTAWTEAIFGDGQQTRGFTFVSDTAAGILAAGLSDGAVGQTINLGNGKEITITRLASMIAEVLGRPDAEITYAERPSRRCRSTVIG